MLLLPFFDMHTSNKAGSSKCVGQEHQRFEVFKMYQEVLGG